MATEKRLISTIAVVVLLATMLCGFSVKKQDAPPERFATFHHSNNITVITDNETGVQYLAYRTAYGTGLTRLEVAEDGN